MKSMLKGLVPVVLVGMASVGHADMTHDHGTAGQQGNAKQATESKMFLEKTQIDGYSVSFHVMPAESGMQHGGSHNLMVKVEQGGQVLNDIVANSKVASPEGKASSKVLMKMGDWYMAGYDLGMSGTHQLMVLFKTSDGKKHFGGVHYTSE